MAAVEMLGFNSAPLAFLDQRIAPNEREDNRLEQLPVEPRDKLEHHALGAADVARRG
jgi:hypothetical protein